MRLAMPINSLSYKQAPAAKPVSLPNDPTRPRKTSKLRGIIGFAFVLIIVVSALLRAATALPSVAFVFAVLAILIFSYNLLMLYQRHSMVFGLGSTFGTCAVIGLMSDTATRVFLTILVVAAELLMLAVSRSRRV